MRYKDVLIEAITNRPHDIRRFVDIKIKQMTAASAALRRAQDAVLGTFASGEEALRYALRHSGRDDARRVDDVAYDCGVGWGDETRLERQLANKSILDNLESWKKFGPDFLHYLADALERSEEPDGYRALFVALSGAEDGFAAEGYTDPTDPDYAASLKLLEALRLLQTALIATLKIIADLKPKIAEIQRAQAARYSGNYRPQHDQIETLYHATAFATEITQDGFKAEPPVGRTGLGNFGTVKTISFTHSLQVAHTISRCLKEVWMIVHGQLTAKALVGWIRKEGLDVDFPTLASTIGLSVKEPSSHPSFPDRSRIKTLDEIVRDNTASDALQVYRVYLWVQKIRSNPVFTNMEELATSMKDRAISDIGVIACEVALAGTEDYLEAEREFRVRPEQVRAVKRLF